MKPALGVLTVVISVGGTLPYIRDILRGETRPSRVTWLLLTLIMTINVFIQGELGVGWARALTFGEFLSVGSVFILSIKYGVGGFELTDRICYVLWLITVIFWLGLGEPLIALHLSILADIVTMAPTLMKSWINPGEESANVWIGTGLAGFTAVFAAENFSYQVVLFPAYVSFIGFLTASIIIISSKRKAHLVVKD